MPIRVPFTRSAGKHAREARDGIAQFKQEFDAGMGDDNPVEEVTRALRSANPREAVSKPTAAGEPTEDR